MGGGIWLIFTVSLIIVTNVICACDTSDKCVRCNTYNKRDKCDTFGKYNTFD